MRSDGHYCNRLRASMLPSVAAGAATAVTAREAVALAQTELVFSEVVFFSKCLPVWVREPKLTVVPAPVTEVTVCKCLNG